MLQSTTRKTGVTLIAFVLLSLVLSQAAPAGATAAFLYYPYYGAARGLNSWFDHEYPNYTTNGSTLIYTGARGAYSYDGHSGYDYPMTYEPVLASATGTVVYAGWADANHEASYGLMLKLDHGNSHQTLYGHMSAIFYTGGSASGRSQIGTSGTTGNSTGPHLHYEVRTYYNGAWRVKDPYGWSGGFTDPWQSSSGVVSEYLWVGSPTTPTPTNYSTTTLDDGDGGFSKWCNTSPCPYWYSGSPYGYGSDMWYTYSNATTETYWASWTPTLPVAGTYEVQVHIPNYNATTHAARYFIQYNGGSRTVYVDQHDTYGPDPGRWVSLGQYSFNTTGGYVQVSDGTYIPGNYTESATSYLKIGVDAVRWIRH